MKTLFSKNTTNIGVSLDYAPDWWRTRDLSAGAETIYQKYFIRVSSSTAIGKYENIYNGFSVIFWKLQLTVVTR